MFSRFLSTSNDAHCYLIIDVRQKLTFSKKINWKAGFHSLKVNYGNQDKLQVSTATYPICAQTALRASSGEVTSLTTVICETL